MTDDLLELGEQGWQAFSSPDPVRFCKEWLAGDALMIVPGMVLDRAMFLSAGTARYPRHGPGVD
jgi:hypothetical protein